MGILRRLREWREDKDGTLIGPDIEADSVNTEQLSNDVHLVNDDKAASDINTLLSTSGREVHILPGDYTDLQERIEIGAANIRVVIHKGAHLKVPTTASPTLEQANNKDDDNNDWLWLIANKGHDDCEVINHGKLEANQWVGADKSNSFAWRNAACVVFQDADGGRVVNHAGETGLYNTSVGVFWIDSQDLSAQGLHSTVNREATVSLEGCVDCDTGDVQAVGGNEAVNYNCYNEHCKTGRVIGNGNSENDMNVLEIEESVDITVEHAHGHNGVNQLAFINARKDTDPNTVEATDPKFTSKTALSDCSNITIDGLTGQSESACVQLADVVNPMQDLSIRGLRCVSNTAAGFAIGSADANQLDGLTVEGKIEATASGRVGANFNPGSQQSGLKLDIEATANDEDAVRIQRWDNVRGRAVGRDTGGHGVFVWAGSGDSVSDHQLEVIAQNNGSKGLVIDPAGNATNSKYTGKARGNSGADVDVSSGTEIVIDMETDFVADSATRTVVNNQSENAGDPSGGSGQWSGHATTAWDLGVRVVDTSNEGDVYEPLPPGATNDWVRHSGTAV